MEAIFGAYAPTILLWIGAATAVAAIFFLVKGVESRTVLLGAGFFLAFASGNPSAAFKAFSTRMVFGGLIEPILSVMGFTYVLRVTKCDAHLINFLAKGLKQVRFLLIPGAVLITGFINVSMVSAAGTAAAAGAILVPMLIASGVRPVMAAAAVYAGTFGSLMSPGNPHNVFIAQKLLNVPVMNVVSVIFWPALVSLVIGALSLTVVAYALKENKGFTPDADFVSPIEKTNLLYAIVPVIPILILMLAPTEVGVKFPWLKQLRISHAMLIGAFIAMIVTRTKPAVAVRELFKGAGDAYASIMGIIISASVFVGGLAACGVVKAFNNMLKNAGDAVGWAAAWGPFLLATITGSGDATILAFNEAVTPQAADYGMTIAGMGSLANLGGALGRTMSPLAAGIIILAGLAKVSTIDVAKRIAPGMIIACFVGMFMLMR